jgi:hypothetical protein
VVLIGLAVGASACLSGPTTLRGQLQAWANNAGYSAIVTQINADLKGLGAGYRERKLLSLRTACEGFSTDAAQLYTQLPTPDQQITNELGNSLTDFFSASVDCYAATSFQSSKFAQYERVLSRARALYSKALTQLASYGVH